MKIRLSLGILIPAVIALALSIDITSRFIPFLSEAATFQNAFVFRRIGDAFVRNASLSGVQYGDLALVGNLPEFRLYRELSFTTDDLGFRNLSRADPVHAVLFGSSFSYSGGTSDPDTLSAQLSSLTGCRVYNAATPADPARQLPTAKEIRAIADRLAMKRGVVIVERLERLGFPAVHTLPWWRAVTSQLPGYTRLRALRESLRQSELVMTQTGPLRLLLEHAFQQIQNDVVLPNPYASLVMQAHLVTGDWMLFYSDEMKSYQTQQALSVEYWYSLKAELERDNLTLVMLLVPNKYTVYHRFLIDPASVKFEPGQSLVHAEKALRKVGVATIDVTPALIEQAESGLGTRTYLYFRDDTHWNAAGIRVAASAVRKVLATTGDECFSRARSPI